MRKHCLKRPLRLLTALSFLSLTSTTQAQVANPPMGSSPWKFANPMPIGYSLTDMSFIDNNTGLAVGTNGGIVRTTDGGRNWQGVAYKYATNTGAVSLASFNDVQFVTPTIAYAVATGGLMIKSTDGGINWAPVTTPLTALGKDINALYFLNKDTGYIGGAAINNANTTNIDDAPKVYFTKDGGATWNALVTPFRPQQNNITLSAFNQAAIQRIHFVNDSVGYVSGSCGNASANFSSILWKIEKNVVKDYSIHRSKFGISATTGSYTPATQTFKGLLGINDSLVLISSLNNNVVIRVQTGKNDSTASAAPAVFGAYERGKYDIVIWLNSVTAPNTPRPANLNGVVAGQMQQIKMGPGGKIFLSSGGMLLNSTDNGTTWNYTRPHPSTVNYSHWAFNALDVKPNGGIVVGTFNGLTYDSIPGTASWQTVYKNARPLFHAFSSMDWADPCNGIVVGSNGTIVKTSDGGKTWVNNSNGVFEAAQMGIGNVFYHSVSNMFFSTSVTVYRSADQGTTNDAIFTEPNPNSFGFGTNQMTMVGKDIAFVAAYRANSPTALRQAVIFRSLNASAAIPVWDTVKTFPMGTFVPQFRNIKFANKDTGYVTGTRGKVYRTVDGGATWDDVSPDSTASGNLTAEFKALSVVNGKTLFIGGSSRKLFKSTDAGATWTDLTLVVPAAPTPVASNFLISNIVMNDATNGYLHSGGIVLKTADAWATWTYDIAPGGFSNIALYPKYAAPIANKKLYGMPVVAGFATNSTQSAVLIEHGTVAALQDVASTETSINASCTSVNGGSLTITATGGLPPYTYSIDGGPFQTSNTFTGLTQGTKSITIKDAACGSVTKTVTVGFTNNLTVNAGPDKTIVFGGSATLNGSSSNTAQTIQWTPANSLTGANNFTPVARPDQTTAYTLTVTDVANCVAKDTAVVTVINECIKVMDAFTPNGDGINDKWMVTNGSNCSTKLSVSVFNRYGGTVYKNDNYNNDWNGTYNGKPVADGTYYYVATIYMIGGRIDQVKGNVTILR